MAWGEMTPEQVTAKLKEAGFDTTQINERLKTLDGVASKAEVEALQNSMKQTQDTLKNLETMLSSRSSDRDNNNDQNRQDNNNNNNNNNQNQSLQIDPLAFMEDPQGSVRKLMQESITPLAIHSLTIAADVAYNMARQRLPYFDVFESEIKELWDKYPPQQKTKPDELIQNLYYLVKGKHADEIATDTAKKEGKYNLVQSGGTTIINRPDATQNKKPEDLLTAEELKAAAQFKITPAEYAAQKGGMKYV